MKQLTLLCTLMLVGSAFSLDEGQVSETDYDSEEEWNTFSSEDSIPSTQTPYSSLSFALSPSLSSTESDLSSLGLDYDSSQQDFIPNDAASGADLLQELFQGNYGSVAVGASGDVSLEDDESTRRSAFDLWNDPRFSIQQPN